jgi:hypothetical protein
MKKHLLVFLTFLTAAAIISWPLVLNLTTAIVDPVDGLLLTWIMNWNIHALISGPIAWFNFTDTNIFYPYLHTLAFSDYHLPASIIALPFVILFKEPLLAFNINFLLGFAFTGFGLYLVVLYITKNNYAAFLTGFVGTFSILHLNYAPHLQLLNIWPVFFAVFCSVKQKYWWFIFFFVASVTTTPLYLYFLLLISIVFLILEKANRAKVLKSLFISLIISFLFLLPFWLVSREFHYTRPITDAINFSLKWSDLFTISTASKLSLAVPATPDTTPGFLGVGMTLIIGAFIVKRFIFKEKSDLANEKVIKIFTLVGISAFVLSFGPAVSPLLSNWS